MRTRDPTGWMWSEAVALIERADRMQRQCFQLGAHRNACPTWEPPIDIFETGEQFILLAALPGVCPEQLVIALDGAVVSVHGQRAMPDLDADVHIHRIEIPYGSFERRVELPVSNLRLGSRILRDGCLLLSLHKPEPR